MSKSYTVKCECGEELEIMWDEDYYGVEQITVKAHECDVWKEQFYSDEQVNIEQEDE